MMKLRPNLRDFKHLESQKYSMGIVLQITNLICSLLNKLFFFFHSEIYAAKQQMQRNK